MPSNDEPIEKKTFTFRKEWFQAINGIKNARHRLEVYEAVARYAFYHEHTELKGTKAAVYEIIVKKLDLAWKLLPSSKKGGHNSRIQWKSTPTHTMASTCRVL